MAERRNRVARGRPRRLASRIAGVACAFVLSHAAPLRAADATPDAARESQLRVAYLLNFARFVEWPQAGAADSLTMCFVASSGSRDAFVTGVTGKLIGSHPVVARIVTGHTAPDGCQVLYIEAAVGSIPDYLSSASPSGVLTVSDTHDFIHKGGIVELFAENNRLRFSVNLENAHRAGLKVSSSLLQLASHVEETGR